MAIMVTKNQSKARIGGKTVLVETYRIERDPARQIMDLTPKEAATVQAELSKLLEKK